MKDIAGYEGLYAITEDGQVWGYKHKHFLSIQEEKGYMRVSLCKNGKIKRFFVHRLVAATYIPNSNNLPEVNHKDENKLNNSVDNLEWVSKSENCLYGTRINKITEKRTKREGGYNRGLRKPVYCIELDRVFDSIKSAGEELGIAPSNIGNVCKGKRKTCGGYHWRYVE